MTAGQVALFLWVSSFVVPVRYLYRRLRRVRVEVSLNDLRTRGVDVSLPSDWLGATCCAGFELGDSAWFRGRERCHLWVHHDYVALVSEGGRPSFALRRSDLVRLHWSPEGRSYSPYPYIRFQVVGGKMVGATIQYDRIHDAALRVNSSGGSAARGPVRFRGWWRGSTAWCTWHPGSGIGTAK